MFFNEDILFRNGPLALVWMAGNDEFKTKKGRRQKHYVTLLKSNLTNICNDLRNLFPQMGTAHGITLKKMGTLAKGIGIIYRIKVEKFEKDVTEACILLKRPVTLQIDMPGERMALKARSKNALDIPGNYDVGNVLVYEENQYVLGFGQFDDPFGVNGFPSPRAVAADASPRRSEVFAVPRMLNRTPPRGINMEHQLRQESTRKRKRDEASDGENYEDVLRKLQVAANVDPRAHLMLEDDPLMTRDPQQDLGGDLDFGNGLDLLNTGDECNMPMGGDPNGEDMPPPQVPDETSVAMDLPSNLEHDTRPIVLDLATPAGAGPRAENVRRRRNEDYRDPDETVMELPLVEPNDQRPGKRARRRLKLQIDVEISISHRDLITRVNSLKKENNMDLLNELLISTRAPPKSYWSLHAHRNKSAIDFITTAGRTCSSRVLNEMVLSTIKKPREQPSMAEEQERVDGTSIAGISATTAVAGRSVAANDSFQLPMPEVIPLPEEDCRPFDDGIGPDLQHPDHILPPQDAGEQQNDPFEIPAEHVTGRRQNNNERALAENLDRGKTFDEMYPPNGTKKRKAARAFLLLLKMQAKKDVALYQEQSFGPITAANLGQS